MTTLTALLGNHASAFGAYSIRHLGVRWARITDAQGTAIALVAERPPTRSFPFTSVQYRIEDNKTDFVVALFRVLEHTMKNVKHQNMTRDDFWKLIDSVDRKALDAGDEDAAIKPLQKRLSSLTVPNLEAFEEHLSQCLYALDGEIFAKESGESGDSDDAFLYARCYVVARGKAHYEATLKNPKLMPKTLDEWCEALLYPHRSAWADLTGEDESEWPFDASVSYESGSNEKQWPKR